MDFISIDLIGPFETTTRGNQYTSAVIYMLTNCIMYIVIPDKSTDMVGNVYQKEVNCRFDDIQKNLSDSGNKLFSDVANQLGIKHSFLSQYRPQANGHIETSFKTVQENSPQREKLSRTKW